MTTRQKQSWSERLFRRLLWLLPFDFSWEHGREMEQDFRRRSREEERNGGGKTGMLKLWWETLTDILRTAPREHLDMLRQDTRYALRSMRKNPSFTIIAVLTLALGIGANTAIFSVLHAVLLRPLPYQEPSQLVHLFETQTNREFSRREASYPDYVDWQERSSVFEGLAGYNGGSVTLGGSGAPERVRVLVVTSNFFDVLGVRPRLGRTFQKGESGPDAPRLVILPYGTWQKRFGADPDIVEKTVQLNQTPRTIIGVLPPEFHFPLRGGGEFVLPLNVSPARQERQYWHWLDVIGRVKPGVSPQQVAADLSLVARTVAEKDPQWHTDRGLVAVPLRTEMVGQFRPVILVLFGAVGIVLLIACTNVASLLLARATARSREVAIRLALGAGRGRLIRQLVTESGLLALVGGIAGVAMAFWGVQFLILSFPQRQLVHLPHLQDFSVGFPVFLFALLVAFLSGLLFGLVPARRALDVSLHQTLKEGGRQGGGLSRNRLGKLLVVAEVSFAVVLLTGAGLMTKSMYHLLQVDPGFSTEHLLTSQIAFPWGGENSDGPLRSFHDEILERIGAIPGVTGVASVSQLPLTGRGNTGSFVTEGRSLDERPEVNVRTVSPSYFETVGIPLVRGRGFDERDIDTAPSVVLVNQHLAKTIFAGANPIGQRIQFEFFEGKPFWEIVGVVGDEQVDHLAGGVTPVVYFPFNQDLGLTLSLVVRSQVEPASLVSSIRRVVQTASSTTPVYAIVTMEQIISDSTPVFLRRTMLYLLGAFSGLAIVLASIGIYGVLSQMVVQRSHEMGIRVALGAQRFDILKLVVGEGMALVFAGLLLGGVASVLLGQLMQGLLFGVSPSDPVTLGGVAVLLLGVALMACYLPGRRAMKVDPMVALRYE